MPAIDDGSGGRKTSGGVWRTSRWWANLWPWRNTHGEYSTYEGMDGPRASAGERRLRRQLEAERRKSIELEAARKKARRARRTGGLSAAQLREEYAVYLEDRYLSDEAATSGQLLRPKYRGRVDPWTFYDRRGPIKRTAVSEELERHWQRVGEPLTFTEWRRQNHHADEFAHPLEGAA